MVEPKISQETIEIIKLARFLRKRVLTHKATDVEISQTLKRIIDLGMREYEQEMKFVDDVKKIEINIQTGGDPFNQLDALIQKKI